MKYRAPATRRRAATSIPAARRPWSAAGPRFRSCAITATARRSPAIFTKPAHDASRGLARSSPRRKDRPAQTHRFIAKREAILDAAARQFNKHGLKGATLADVAGSVDLLTNSVTYYYRRKEDLVAACLLRAIETMQGVAVAALAAPSPEARIRAFICGQAAVLADIAANRRDDLVNFNDIRTLRPPLVDHVFAAYTEMFRSVRRLLPKEGAGRAGAQRARASAAVAGQLDAPDGSGASSPTTIAMPPIAWATSSLTGWRARQVNG